jgi:hypothetical protein
MLIVFVKEGTIYILSIKIFALMELHALLLTNNKLPFIAPSPKL